MASSLAKQRLLQERKAWRKDHPHAFSAKPKQNPDGTTNIMIWECSFPGKAGTRWAGGVYPVVIEFGEDYPSRPPKVRLPQGFFHPNIYPSGTVCLSILNEDEDWKPGITVKQMLLGVQDLLDNPNPNSPAQSDAYSIYIQNKQEYFKRVANEVAKYPPQ